MNKLKELCNDILDKRLISYRKRNRDIFDGPLNIGTALKLREDFYSVAFLYQLKRKAVCFDNKEEDAAPEADNHEG